MRTALECQKIREKKIEEYNNERALIEGQFKFIEGRIDNANINRNTKYIELGKIELYKENIEKLISLGYLILVDKNGQAKLYFDTKDYTNINFNSDKKANLNKNTNDKIVVGRKVEGDNSIYINDEFDKLKDLLKNQRVTFYGYK